MARQLREEVKSKYREVATNPNGEFHFHTGWRLASRRGYEASGEKKARQFGVYGYAFLARKAR